MIGTCTYGNPLTLGKLTLKHEIVHEIIQGYGNTNITELICPGHSLFTRVTGVVVTSLDKMMYHTEIYIDAVLC